MEKTQKWKSQFMTVALGQAVSMLGSHGVQFALIWWLAETTSSPLMLGISGLVAYLPMTLFSPLAGIAADLCRYFNPLFFKMRKGEKMIREFRTLDTEQVMKLWLLGNVDAHPFAAEEYWYSHFNEVQEALLQAEVFVYDINGKVLGFIGLTNEYIAGIFVDRNYRSTGIGTQLLTYVKQKYDTLSLSVYQQNLRAVAFYHSVGFSILSEGIDEDTGEKEYTMFWKNKR